MALELVTAGESHGPALVAIVTGLPAGLVLDREAIDADLRRRQQGYGRSPRQQHRAGHRRGARRSSARPHARDAARARRAEPRPRELEVGDEPLAPGGRAIREGHEARHAPAARVTPISPARSSTGSPTCAMRSNARARGTPQRSSLRARSRRRCCASSASRSTVPSLGDDLEQRVDEARADRDTVGGVVEVRARGVPPGLGSYATKDERLDARLAATLMGTQAVKGVEIGDGLRARAPKRGSEAHDEILRDDRGLYRETNHAGGIEGGISNGEEIVVRAAMKPLPTLMRPLASVDLETRRARRGARRAERHRRGRGARGRRGGMRRVGACACGAREVRRRRARATSSPPTTRTWSGSTGSRARAEPASRARRLHGRRQVDARAAGRRAARPSVHRPRPRPRAGPRNDDPGVLRAARRDGVPAAGGGTHDRGAAAARPAVIALGGGAVQTPSIRNELRDRAFTVLLEVDPDTAWERSAGERSAARAGRVRVPRAVRAAARALRRGRRRARVRRRRHRARGGGSARARRRSRRAGLVRSRRRRLSRSSPIRTSAGSTAPPRRSRSRSRLASVHEVPQGEAAKTAAVAERLWSELRLTATALIVALGGGSTTDVAGFVAATYLRGIAWLAVPTTLVGQVDAAIGGKTAIDLPAGQEPRRRVPLAGTHRGRSGHARDAAGGRAPRGHGRGRQDRPARRRAALGAARRLSSSGVPPLSRRASACATRTSRASAQSSTSGTRSRMRSRPPPATRASRTGAPSRSACSPHCASRARPTDVVDDVLAPQPVRVDRDRAWTALRRDKKARGGRASRSSCSATSGPVVETRPEDEVRSALDELIAE